MRKLQTPFYVTLFALCVNLLAPMVMPAKAASITTLTVVPTSSVALATTNVTLTFSPVPSITTGTILQISYDPAFTGGSSLDFNDITISGTNFSSKVCSGFIAGYFTCTVTTSAPIVTPVTILIGGVHKLTNPAAGNYSFSVTANIGGTGTTFDAGAGLAYIAGANQVVINALVVPVLSLDLYNSGSLTLMTDPNTCNLGALSINTISTCAYDIGIGTNNAGGAVLSAQAAGGMISGSNTLAAATGIGLTAGTEAYGFHISGNGTVFSAIGSYATGVQAVPGSATQISGSLAVSNKATLVQHINITHSAAVSTSTPTGNYSQTVSYTVFSK